ncbi:MAG: 50S ribosomal protein L3 N(5)-glutamine methyltransferase, partial [Opitutaceae bacterium]
GSRPVTPGFACPPHRAGGAPAGDWLRAAERAYVHTGAALGQIAADAHDEALYLLLHGLRLPLDAPESVLTRALTAGEREALERLLRRRLVERVPAAYLTREAWLGRHRFYVDERVIIPRSYFLEMIPEMLGELLPSPRPGRRMLDVCTGSGCLALLLAHGFPDAEVVGCDLSTAALEVAALNVRAHRLEARVRFCRSDVLASVPPGRYDLILSNPPYEPSAHVDRQAPEFAAEPRLAHDGGADGLRVIRELIRQASQRLVSEGLLVIEVGGLRRAVEREFATLAPEWLPTADGSNCVVLFRAANLGRGVV